MMNPPFRAGATAPLAPTHQTSGGMGREMIGPALVPLASTCATRYVPDSNHETSRPLCPSLAAAGFPSEAVYGVHATGAQSIVPALSKDRTITRLLLPLFSSRTAKTWPDSEATRPRSAGYDTLRLLAALVVTASPVRGQPGAGVPSD